jgi:phosphoserine phosphatase
VVAIGDGANDLLMLKKAGLGIAVHAKEKVRKESPFQMNYSPMTGAFHLMGIHNETI